MKSFLGIFLLSCIAFASYSQSVEYIKADKNNYLWGEGSGSTLESADKYALAMLINQISVSVESSFTSLREEVSNLGKQEFQEVYKGVINTFSSATLQNTERIVISNEPEAKVFRYIKRNEIDKIFSGRKRKLEEFARYGEEAARSGKIADALRYYYWSLTLLRSLPEPNTVVMPGEQNQERLLMTWLPLQINNIFSDISISIADTIKTEELTRYIFNIKYQNKPARNFDYSYWTGRDWTNTYSGKDGIGIAEFIGNNVNSEIRLKAEYIFEGETAVDHELKEVMGKLGVIPFPKSYFNIDQTGYENKQDPKEKRQNLKEKTHNLKEKLQEPIVDSGNLTMVQNVSPYEQTMAQLVNYIRSGNYQDAQTLFTTEGYELYKNILEYGQARIITEPKFKYFNFEKGVMCRTLPMSFHFNNNNKNFIEDVIFYFDENKKISNITFGLDRLAINDIANKEVWEERIRLIIINFLENYKTAYALKRVDYLESLFADDALIIVGSVLKVKSTGDNPFRNNDIVRFNRYTKEEFIRNLKHSFDSNEYINIRFQDNIIRKSGKGGEIYGIEIKQDYFSSNYGDSGYLFLMVNFNDPDQPVIHVRTWHPDKNFSLADFQ